MDAGNLCLCADSAVLCDLYRNISFRILRRPRIKPNGVGLSFFQINTVIRLIPEALSGILRRVLEAEGIPVLEAQALDEV